MKTLSIALVLCVTLVFAAAASAQLPVPVPSFGVKAGLALATLSGDDTDGVSSKAGFIVGGFASVPMGPSLSLQPELLYMQKGAKEDFLGTELKLKLDYFEIPVLLKYSLPGVAATPYFILGPALGIKSSAKITDGNQTADVDDIKSTDFSVVFGAGVNIQKFLLEARYSLGLSSIDDSVDPASVKNNVIGLMAGISF